MNTFFNTKQVLADISTVTFIKDIKKNKLYEVKPVRVFAPVGGGETQLLFKNAGKEKSYGISSVELYANKSAYERGEKITTRTDLMYTYIRNAFEDIAFVCVGGESVLLTSYVLKDGVPTEIDTPIKGIEFSPDLCSRNPIFNDGVDKDTLYPSLFDATKFNSYKYIAEDGSVQEQEGSQSYVLLTEEQKAAVEEFKAAAKKLRELKVLTLFDSDYEELSFVNRNNCAVLWNTESQDEAHERGVILLTELPKEQRTKDVSMWTWCCDAPSVEPITAKSEEK